MFEIMPFPDTCPICGARMTLWQSLSGRMRYTCEGCGRSGAHALSPEDAALAFWNQHKKKEINR